MESRYHSGGVGQRHALMVLTFFGYIFMYATRVGLSVSMVAMTKSVAKVINVNSTENSSEVVVEVCPLLQKDPPTRTSDNSSSSSSSSIVSVA
ncbi:hypothetical protein BV898_12937 [Hypsibius exemplaris]|uniref:Uncharacterized protein n=1 Tax=Hypsibius exemplaris TaxID=2072580 RepID=A0A1W0WCB2_HYPEX|nr:hypothetical protein BV898_12937 [Hypsibius exemplaris]